MTEKDNYYEELEYTSRRDNSWNTLSEEFKEFLSTRASTLFALPVLDKEKRELAKKRLNPIPAINAMSRHQWNSIFSWLQRMAVLMLRPIGSIIFGLAADKYGRKWPLIFCYALFIIFEIATGFTKNLRQFLAVRALFGIAMGGCYGLGSSTAFEDSPEASRGFLSGIYQPAYTFGFVLATAFHRAFYNTAKCWRALFWFSAGPALIMLFWRLSFGELDYFINLQEARKLHNLKIHEENEDISSFNSAASHNNLCKKQESNLWSDLKTTLRFEWPILLYLVLNLSVFNFLSHGSQDLFPTMLSKQIKLSTNALTVTNVVVNLGGCFGGPVWGQISEILGRRLTMMLACLCVGAFIYPTFFVHSQSVIMGCGFMLQFCIMGAWGVLPIYLTELTATTSLRALISGTAYQIGTLASSASSTIEAELGAKFPLPALGSTAYDYGKVMCIFLSAVAGSMLVVLFFGPEKFHQVIKTDFMLEEQDASSDVDIHRIVSSIPTSDEEAKLRAQKSYEERHARST